MSTRIGVDIGGTFTDLVYYDETDGSVVVAKVPTTPAHPERGCINAVEVGVPHAVLKDARYFLHGTTVGLNALLERRGPTIGMLTTAGFRDVLEIRNASRGEPYNMYWRPKAPLVSRDLRLGVRERCTFDGQIQLPLVEQDVLDAYDTFREANVNSIAIMFLHSYANPEHELQAEQILRGAGFNGHISVSHKVSGEYRDYERGSTTVVDAFVRARMSGYLDHIDRTLKQSGFAGTCLMMRSGSGSMTFADAQERPFETINSGPVGGAEGASQLSQRLGIPNLITADVGGTSFDACLIIGGRPRLLHAGEVDGMPLQTPWVDVRSIGSGGGSIADVDVGGLMTVGPRSAGAEPGPACYGRGGTLATTTDAAFYLGMLGGGELASGLSLDREASERALTPLAERLDCTIEQAAKGVIAIASNHMASLIRDLTIEQGIDPREFKLLPFGGAGPMMATQIARELGITKILVPPHAGNFSAWGLLGADLLRSRARTHVTPLSAKAIDEANTVLAELLRILMDDENSDKEALEETLTVTLDLRFMGQEHTLSVSPEHQDGRITQNLEQIEALFHAEYVRHYGATLDAKIQLVTIRASRRRALPVRSEKYEYQGLGSPKEGEYFSFVEDRRMTFSTVQRGALDVGKRYSGPAIVYEPTTTTYVDSDFTYGVDESGCLSLQSKGQ
ncbi:hydantoinase/oxoprolinase family protein [Sphingomonas sp.]|uniref:hydantoinase/oxoprolinase family protein n=1 Tax=Sphingomonas sp. TaxID=28214 RepID=UPI003D6D0F4F